METPGFHWFRLVFRVWIWLSQKDPKWCPLSSCLLQFLSKLQESQQKLLGLHTIAIPVGSKI